MAGYWFFLSYARRDAVGNLYVERFHKQLAREIGRVAGLPAKIANEEIGFFDTEGVKPGEPWPEKLAYAIQTSKVFVCLYSPAYFNSDYCGKELQAFRSRLAASTSPSPSHAIPTLIFPVLWDRADRLPKVLPQVLKDIQYAHGSTDEIYKGEGLYQLLSLNKHRDRCSKFFDNMAAMIVQRVREHPLPPADFLTPLHEIESAFNVQLENSQPERPVGQRGNMGPRTAEFVFVAANETEIRERRDRVEAYGSEGGRDWRPYLSKAVGFVGQTLSTQEELFYEDLPADDRLLERLREAEKKKNIVVIVIDPWTIQLKSYQKRMLDYDKNTFVNTEILIPWNEQDQETEQALKKLRSDIRQTFCRHYIVNTSYIHDSITSLADLERELAVAISRARSRIIQMSEFVRPMDTTMTLPRYSRPAGYVE